MPEELLGTEIALIGMAGRFPGAPDIDTFWRNLRDGVESIVRFSDDDLLARGLDPEVLRDPGFVKAGAPIEHSEMFDAAFFGYSPKEAEMIDPQQRVFLECAWAALEHAGYHAEGYGGAIGVYAGSSLNTYLLVNLATHPEVQRALDRRLVNKQMAISVENAGDFLTTRVSYKLNLRGPSHLVQCACSTALAAVHIACQGLLSEECDMALAGGVSINLNQHTGYFYQEGGIASPDGHCRAFDADAAGTILGSGVGVVVLKRLEDALADGDTIYAVIRGSALNNDGALKVGFTAPSVDGQAAVIAEALANAGVPADTIGYVEAHGTGTPLGDPIEIQALTKAFRASTARSSFCPVGSVKTNIGHLDIAAGIAGLIKTALALHHRQIPPSLHFHQPNPQIDFPATPFYVNTRLADWPATGAPRRAGVSSFGIGGTNVHVVLEEAPPAPHRPAPERAQPQLLVLSAKTAPALALAATRLAAHLDAHPDLKLADVAFTLQAGRQVFAHRRAVVAHDAPEAARLLSASVAAPAQAASERPIAFLLPGQGAQAAGMGLALAQTTPALAQTLTLADRVLLPLLGRSLHAILADPAALAHTALAQPALLALEYALAHVALAAGLRPAALLGHSLGELTAATLAGVFSFPDALALAVTRGRLLEAARGGQMLAVALAPDALAPWLAHAPALDLAAVNGPQQCVLSGPAAAVATLAQRLAAAGITTRVVQTDYAFHSAQLDGAAAAFSQAVAQVRRAPPQLPLLSNVHGAWLDAATAQEPAYWGQQLRAPVQFAAGLDCLVAAGVTLGLEVGPGQVLRGLAGGRLAGVALLPRAGAPDEAAQVLAGVGEAWARGAAVAWEEVRGAGQKRRVGLPTYPFARQRFWVEPRPQGRASAPGRAPDIADWFYMPGWRPTLPPPPPESDRAEQPGSWLVLADDCGVGAALAARLGHTATLVVAGERFAGDPQAGYTIEPRRAEDYAALLADLRARGRAPRTIVHCWSITAGEAEPGPALFDDCQARGYGSLILLAQALAQQPPGHDLRIVVVSSGMQCVYGEREFQPAKRTLLGPCKVLPQEQLGIACQSIDIAEPPADAERRELLAEQLLAEIAARTPEPVLAYRGHERLAQSFERVRLERAPRPARPLRERGVYMITGGLGRVGLLLAEHLARAVRARLVLLGRAGLPAPEAWEAWLAAHDADEPTSRLIARLQAIEALGAEVLVLRADVADAPAIRAVLQQIDARFGALHGVIHAAGALAERSGFGPIAALGQREAALHFPAKAHGLYVLERVLRERRLDFCLLLSSNAAVLGGLGFAGYAAANLFLDAFAQRQSQRGPTPWISVNWDTWLMPGEQPESAARPGSDEYALTPQQSAEAFERIVTQARAAQVVVSAGDLAARLDAWIGRKPAPAEPASLYQRPDMPTPYVAPATELEQALARIWRQALGVEQVGLDDNFFDLGGHSLLAIQALAQLKQELGIDLPVASLYERLTIRALAELLDPRREEAAAERDSAEFEEKERRASWRKQYQQSRRDRKQSAS